MRVGIVAHSSYGIFPGSSGQYVAGFTPMRAIARRLRSVGWIEWTFVAGPRRTAATNAGGRSEGAGLEAEADFAPSGPWTRRASSTTHAAAWSPSRARVRLRAPGGRRYVAAFRSTRQRLHPPAGWSATRR